MIDKTKFFHLLTFLNRKNGKRALPCSQNTMNTGLQGNHQDECNCQQLDYHQRNKYCPVKIFGPDIRSLKKTRKKPEPDTNDEINIPSKLTMKQQKIILCINGIKVNSLLFLTTISKTICFQMVQLVVAKTINNYKKALIEKIQLYNKARFKVTKIRNDMNSFPKQTR